MLASRESAHRKKYKDADVNTYKRTFVRNTGLSKSNLIVLTNTFDKDFSVIESVTEVEVSDNFERIV